MAERRSPRLKRRGSFLCDRHNSQNNLLAADDCLAQWPTAALRSRMIEEKMCHFNNKQLKMTVRQ